MLLSQLRVCIEIGVCLGGRFQHLLITTAALLVSTRLKVDILLGAAHGARIALLLPGDDELVDQTHVIGPSKFVDEAQAGEALGQLGVHWYEPV